MGKRNAQPDDELPTIDKATGRLDFFSVSSLKSFKLCPRLWWFDKVRGLPGKQTKGAKLGDEAHQRVEHYLLTGEDVRGPVEREGAHLLEPYRLSLISHPKLIQVEATLAPRLKTPGGVTLRGFTDLLVPPEAAVAGEQIPEFVDHKFLRNFDYAPGEAELRDDTQGLGYAAWGLLVRWPGAQRLRFTHHQHAREGRDRKPRRVSVVHDLTAVRAAWEEMSRVVDRDMAATATMKDEALVPVGDTKGDDEGKGTCCDAFGRCSYRSVCSASPENRFASRFHIPPESRPMATSLTAQLLAQNLNPTAKAQAAQATASTPAPGSQTPAPVIPSKGGLLAKDAKPGTVYALPEGKTGTFLMNSGGFSIFSCGDGSPATIKDSTEIAAVPSASPEVLGDCEVCEGKLDAKNSSRLRSGGLFHVGCPGPKPAPVTPPAPVPEPVTTQNVGGSVLAPDAPPSNPGEVLPTREQIEAKLDTDETITDSAALQAVQEAAQAAQPEKKPRGGRKPKDAPSEVLSALASLPEFIIFVGTTISMPVAKPLAPVIQEIARELAEAAKVVDVRCADKSSPLAYGGWKGALGEGVEKKLAPGVYYLDPGELADVVIERLSGKALVVRGR